MDCSYASHSGTEQAMRLAKTDYEVEYPETDGAPMGETELHIHWTIRLRDILKHRYGEQRVYVGTNMFIYYVEGEPYRNVCPDVFVVLDCDPHLREIYKVWDEGKPPTVVIEITSKSTRREDEVHKPEKYARIGVAEYFLYDPKAEYLRPPLAGFRRVGTEFQRIELNDQGALESPALGVTLELDGTSLLVRDAASGDVLLTSTEAAVAAQQRAEAAQQRAEALAAEAQTAHAADKARIAQLEAELLRLRRQP
jgi:Uma2 family endonuclease